jgi:diguanylate cyclase (GGDEF)-like protein/PAS domain S-box-containing protein
VRAGPRWSIEENAEVVLPLISPGLLHWAGVLGPAPLWYVLAVGTACAAVCWRPLQLRLAGGDLSRRVGLRTGLHLAALTAMIYPLGWGPVLAFSYTAAAAIHLRWSGAKAWPALACWTIVFGGLGQLAVGTGLLYSKLEGTPAQVAGWSGLLAAVIVVRQTGMNLLERDRAQAELRNSEQRFRALVHNSVDVVFVADRAGVLSYASPSADRVMGYGDGWLPEGSWLELVAPTDRPAGQDAWAAVLATPAGEHHAELRLRHADGGHHWHEIVLRNLLQDPAVGGVVINHRDISERRAYQDLLVYDASHDMLTGLANRAVFARELATNCARSRHGGPPGAVLLLDLDGFKQVNDSHGHRAGDDVLVAVAKMLKDRILGSDLAARLGGDEFAAVLTAIEEPADAYAVAERIGVGFREPIMAAGHPVQITASIGIALTLPDHPEAEELLRRADTAMYEAKHLGKAQTYLYTAQPNQDAPLRAREG